MPMLWLVTYSHRVLSVLLGPVLIDARRWAFGVSK